MGGFLVGDGLRAAQEAFRSHFQAHNCKRRTQKMAIALYRNWSLANVLVPLQMLSERLFAITIQPWRRQTCTRSSSYLVFPGV